jgi:putative transposase
LVGVRWWAPSLLNSIPWAPTRPRCQLARELVGAYFSCGAKVAFSYARKGYDSDATVDFISQSGAGVVIPPKKNRTIQRPCDFALYCERNLVERYFNKIKHYRAIATGYAKRARNYMAFVALVSTMLWLK